MIEYSLLAWALLFFVIAVSSFCGVTISNRLCWTLQSLKIGLNFIFGIALGPFLLGLFSIVTLVLFPGKSSGFHLLTTVLLLLVSAFSIRHFKKTVSLPRSELRLKGMEKILFGLLLLWFTGMTLDVLFTPLVQNDALEYAMVGRFLSRVHDIFAYPLIDSRMDSSGFFGPWTHPPLYVTLIYIFNAIQGHINAPGLMRIIAPWFAVTSTALVWALGRFRNMRTALIAALIMFSTPLFFLGAGSSLIDALSIAGLTLTFAAFIGLQNSDQKYVVVGLSLGIAMWAHSQGILFPALIIACVAFSTGSQKFAQLFRAIAIIISSATLLAAAPYVRNYLIFGSPISDNPVIFALPSLHWDTYFEMARGISGALDKIQYGLFKGWFVLDAYGSLFWLMTLGVVYNRHQLEFKKLFKKVKEGTDDLDPIFFGTVIISVYLLGVAASILCGTDLMIKNERYQLIILPFAALLAGNGLSKLFTSNERFDTAKSLLSKVMLCSFIICIIAQFYIVGGHRWKTFGVTFSNMLSPMKEKQERWPNFLAIEYINKIEDPHSLILSMRPADMYYSNKRMLSFLEPKLTKFYSEQDKHKAVQILKSNGIRYIQTPDYAHPPIYNSALESILYDRTLSRLVFDQNGNQVYELEPSEESVSKPLKIDIAPSNIKWTIYRKIAIGGRKGVFKFTVSQDIAKTSKVTDSRNSLPFFQREFQYYSESDIIKIPQPTSSQLMNEFAIEVKYSGNAFAALCMSEYDIAGNFISSYRIGELLIEKSEKDRTFFKRLTMPTQAAYIVLSVEAWANADLNILQASLIRNEVNASNTPKPNANVDSNYLWSSCIQEGAPIPVAEAP